MAVRRSSNTVAKNQHGPTVVYDYSNDMGWYGYAFVSVRVPVTQVHTVAWYVNPEHVRHENIVMGRVIGWFEPVKKEIIEDSISKASDPKRPSQVSYTSSFAAYCERRDAWGWADLPRPGGEGCGFLDFESSYGRSSKITITSSEDEFFKGIRRSKLIPLKILHSL